MKIGGIDRAFAAGARLAAAGLALLALCAPAGAMESWMWNYTSFSLNESVPLAPVLDPNSGTMVFLLSIIAFCQLFNLLVKLLGWFLNDHA